MDQHKSPTSIYLDRYAWPNPLLSGYQQYLRTRWVVVIPAYNEPDIVPSLKGLNACIPPAAEVLVIIIINEPENASEDIKVVNQRTKTQASDFQSWFHLEVVHANLPQKKAGVGLARKIGMDEAVRIFSANQSSGIIVCFDADCICDSNYFLALESYYEYSDHNLGVVYYEHSLEAQFPDEITKYEIFLRYYIDALRYAGFPYAIQTLGSCITVRSNAYEKQGGMNTRKAGEDFYFIHKVIPLGGVGEINETCIRPSDRLSDRVPFGTGHAIGKYLSQPDTQDYTYAPEIFEDLKILFSLYTRLFQDQTPLKKLNLPESILSFMKVNGFEKDLINILKQSNNLQNFNKRFFSWWDGFRVLKFVHYARDHFHPNKPLAYSTDWLISAHFQLNAAATPDLEGKLKLLRHLDRETDFDFYIK